jgi:hypothetical protein
VEGPGILRVGLNPLVEIRWGVAFENEVGLVPPAFAITVEDAQPAFTLIADLDRQPAGNSEEDLLAVDHVPELDVLCRFRVQH